MHTRRATRRISLGNTFIGGNAPISLQTMWKQPLKGADEDTMKELHSLVTLGCEIIRFAVPDEEAAEIVGTIARELPIPIVADIHFDHRLALKCIEEGVTKIRINPGNIGASWKVKDLLERADSKNVPLRIGINGGSLPRKLRQKENIASAMIEAAEKEIEFLEKHGFKNAVFSLKASNVRDTVEANRNFSARYDYPLHIGITEAGPLIPGIVKNTLGIGTLLREGIGDTVRVSLSSPSKDEIITGREILRAENIRDEGMTLVSCPRCGRATFDVHSFAKRLEDSWGGRKKKVQVAVMGCVVNGPEEAKHADLGITGAGKEVVLFKKGSLYKKISEEEAFEVFLQELELL